MSKRLFQVVLLLLITLPGAIPVLAADIPVLPYIEVSVATEGPLSVLSIPDGSGHSLTRAFDQAGQLVDGTITMILYDDTPPWGIPVANYPREDIWLTDLAGDLVFCQRGGVPDRNTDANGMTSWTEALLAGGHVEPVDGNQLAVMINGWIPGDAYLPDYRINSADINGDLVVNLVDVSIFVTGYYGPYNYTSDLHWDGAVNLSDVSVIAQALGAHCP